MHAPNHLIDNRWKPASISAPFCKNLRRQRRTWSPRLAKYWSRGTQPIWMSAIASRSPARIIVGSLTGRDFLSKRTTWLEFAATCSRCNASCVSLQRRIVDCKTYCIGKHRVKIVIIVVVERCMDTRRWPSIVLSCVVFRVNQQTPVLSRKLPRLPLCSINSTSSWAQSSKRSRVNQPGSTK